MGFVLMNRGVHGHRLWGIFQYVLTYRIKLSGVQASYSGLSVVATPLIFLSSQAMLLAKVRIVCKPSTSPFELCHNMGLIVRLGANK